MVNHGPSDPDAPARSAPPATYTPPIPPADELPKAYVYLLNKVAKLKDDFDQAEYYRQLHGKRIDELEHELHALRARNWRLEAELMELHRGNDWNAAAKMVQDVVTKLLADPKCNRRLLREGAQDVVETIRSRGILPETPSTGPQQASLSP
jgi:hypothetical protein